ncbi:MAG TPA: pseudouridine synthase [Candidatus Dormibacteraeota bacterium]|nr:pseudouridine synthase [Candidatus Dormibacteraeota bacterium]
MKTRLNKFLAEAGVASRRTADAIIAAGRVRVNGHVERTLGSTVTQSDRIEVDGAPLTRPAAKTYVVLHKPVGVVTTMRDPERRRTVRDLIPGGIPRVVPVGRLDYDSSGVLLLTDDGELAYRLTHPRFGVEKTYHVEIAGPIADEDLRTMRDGLALPALHTRPSRVRVLGTSHRRSCVELTLQEGKNRQIRRMLDALGYRVLSLQRVRFGPVALGELRPGKARFLNAKELKLLRRIVAAKEG